SGFTIAPGLKRDEKEAVVSGPHKAEQAEADNARGVFNAGRIGEYLLNLLRRCARTLQRSRMRKVHIDVHIPLVFIGQEARWQMAAKETCPDAESRDHHQSQHTLAKNPTAELDVDPGAALEHAIEPIKELAQRPVTLSLWSEEQSGKCGAQRECVKGGEDHRNGDGDGKLLIEPSCDAGDEGCRYKHRG